MRKADDLSRLYERNPATGNYIIEIALDQYVDIFNEWDHSSLRKRDMDPELAIFLEDCSNEIPLRHGLDLFFYLPRDSDNLGKEPIVTNLVKTYYTFYGGNERKRMERLSRRALTYVAASFGLLASTYLFGRNPNVLVDTLMQGLTVGGWVFLWEAISFFFIERSENVEKIKLYERLANAGVFFHYENK